MDRIINLLLILIFSVGTIVAGEKGSKNELNWLSFDAGSAAAAKEKKKIMVDVYTDWCGWCKRLDKDTYNDPTVMKYLQEKFIVVKLNPEVDGNITFKGKKISNGEFAQQMGVRGYPTMIFLEPTGEVITGISSYLKPKDFLNVAHFISESKYNSMSWDEYVKSLKD